MVGDEGIREGHIDVRRTGRYYLAGGSAAPAEVWYVCHGYRQLAARFIRRFSGIAGPSRLVVAPEGLSRFYLDESGSGPHGPESKVGASWMTREDRAAEIADYVRYLDALRARLAGERHVAATRERVLGFSQGTATVTRWVTYGAIRPSQLILWAGLPAHDLDPVAARERLSGVDLVFAFGDRDPMATGETRRRAEDWLDRHGLEARFVEYRGGHRVEPEALRLLLD